MAKEKRRGQGKGTQDAHRGNKAALPSKVCAACGLAMTWRRSWASNWDEVKYCSERCRRNKGPG